MSGKNPRIVGELTPYELFRIFDLTYEDARPRRYSWEDDVRDGDIHFVCDMLLENIDKALDVLRRSLGRSFPKVKLVSTVSAFVTKNLDLHIDRTIRHDLTMGVVFTGHHILKATAPQKQRPKTVGILKPGTVFLINNKLRHGAWQKDADSGNLLFVAFDFSDNPNET